ncbi:hypothetical protein [Calothrix sp. UHCC 0171]|uniref:hypothetical protein n=1 Tax=Calothrix sp. UHCC 0171 TaxID=3110245 RepID=UPI002B217FE7|nr:hypothetical protein [Calothrix sp. UHCC 0171]MEA5572988.1 hypothetical protein [Calothrix sp. UHCC 0171]
MMKIADLSYLENAPENKLLIGGASGTIGAEASAGGANSLALTDTDLTLKTKKNGGSKLKGTGFALAIGENPETNVYYSLEGFDKVKVKTFDKQGANYDLEIMRIKAIDKPNK